MNPILKFKEDHHLTWFQMSVASEISVPQLMRMAEKNDAQLQKMSLRTAKLLKKNLGLDI